MTTANITAGAQAFPLYHHESHYYMASEEPEYQSMLAVWHQVADVLKTKPAGTLAMLASGESLFISAMDGELFMFVSGDMGHLDGTQLGTGVQMQRPTEFETVYGDAFDDLNRNMTHWLESPAYFNPLPADFLAACVKEHYERETVGNWCWNGNDPKAKH